EIAHTKNPVAAADNSGYFRRSPLDWLAAGLLAGGGLVALNRYAHFMDGYEQAILIAAIPTLIALAWAWAGMRNLLAGAAVLALSGIALYDADLARAEQAFFLKYFLSSQTAIGWMCFLFFL